MARYCKDCRTVEVEPKRKRCRACLEQHVPVCLAMRVEAVASGWCTRCLKRDAQPGTRTCTECVERRTDQRRAEKARLAKNAVRKRVARDCAKRAGLCSQCGLREPDAGYACCRTCIDSKIAYRHRSAA